MSRPFPHALGGKRVVWDACGKGRGVIFLDLYGIYGSGRATKWYEIQFSKNMQTSQFANLVGTAGPTQAHVG